MTCTPSLNARVKNRIATLLLAAAVVTVPSLTLADDDEAQLYLQMEAIAEKSGKTALDTAAEVLKAHPGYMIKFEADYDNGQLLYEYEIMQPAENRVIEVDVNAVDGRILKTRNDRIDRELPDTDKDMKELMPFLDAWHKAEKEFGKYVIEAELDEDSGRLFYEFEILESFRESKVLLDARTGNPIPVFEHH